MSAQLKAPAVAPGHPSSKPAGAGGGAGTCGLVPGTSHGRYSPQDAQQHRVHLRPQHGLTMGPKCGLTSCQACHTAGNCPYKDRTLIKTVINRAVCVSVSCMVQLGLIWYHR